MVDGLTRGYRPGYEAFSASSSEIRYFDDVMREPGYVPIDDCLSVSLVQRNGNTVTSGNYKLWPYNRTTDAMPATHLYLAAFASIPTDVFTGSGFYNYPFQGVGAAGFAITGVWGYCTAANRPPVIKEVTLKIAKQLYDEAAYTAKDMMQAVANPSNWVDKAIIRMLERSGLMKTEGSGGGALFA